MKESRNCSDDLLIPDDRDIAEKAMQSSCVDK